MFFKTGLLKNFHRKTPVLESLFNKALCREICRIFKNTYFYRCLWWLLLFDFIELVYRKEVKSIENSEVISKISQNSKFDIPWVISDPEGRVKSGQPDGISS